MNAMETNQATEKARDTQMLRSSLLKMAQAPGDDSSSAGPPGLSATPTLSGLLHALRRRWQLAVGVACVAAVVGVLAVFYFVPAKYVTTIRVRIAAKQLGAEDVEFPLFKANMEAMVKSPIVISAALNEKTSDGRDIKDLELVRNMGLGTVEWLEKALKTDFLLGPEVLRVTLSAEDPEDAAELLNAIAKAFTNEYSKMELSKKQARLADLRTKKEVIQEEMRMYRTILQKLYDSLDVKDYQAIVAQQQEWMRKLSTEETTKRALEQELTKWQTTLNTYKGKLKGLDKQTIPEEFLLEAFGKDRNLEQLQKRIADIDDLIADYFRKYNEDVARELSIKLKHEKVDIRKLVEQREMQLRPSIDERWRKRVREEFENKIEEVNANMNECRTLLDHTTKLVMEFERKVKDSGPGNQNKPPQILAMEEKIELAKMALTHTSQKISDAELETPGSRLQNLQRAVAPMTRDRSKQTKAAGAGGLGLFIMALFGVAFLEFRSRKIGDIDDVVTGLGLKVIGTIPAKPVPRAGTPVDPIVDAAWQHRLQESIDSLRTVLLHQARSKSLHIIMVTSAGGGEGKTTLASQLAASFARAWKRTLLIDGDMRHPTAHVLFDAPQEPGMSELLRGEVEPADAIRATPLSRLWILPAGISDTHSLQALAQENVRTLFEKLKQQYDFIIIDTPPVLPVTDALLIGQHVDGVLFSVLRDVSRSPAVHAAQQKIAPLDVPMLGAVVLGADGETGDDKYNYGPKR